MTREEIKLIFPDASDEQITKLLNKSNAEVATEKGKVQKLQAKADSADELQRQLDEINAQGQSELEKANSRIAQLEKQNAKMLQREALANVGITGEDADNLIKEDGTLDYATLDKVIKEREAKAATAKEQEIANNSTNPNGDKGSSREKDPDDKPEDVKNAELLVFSTVSKDAMSARDYYK